MFKSQTPPIWTPMGLTGLAVLLSAWFAGAYVLGVERILENHGQSFFAPVALSAVVPVVTFLALYRFWPAFKNFVLSQDIITLSLLQLWRVMGFGFLTLYYYDVLPGLFAWPAGLGDVAVGMMAAVIFYRLARNPKMVTSTQLVRFHLLGLFDFVVAVVTAGLASGVFPGLIPLGITSAPMDVWPFNLFPSFFVPVFIILHLTVLLKIRHLRASQPQAQTQPVAA